MLVLGRKLGEGIRIGAALVKVHKIQGDHVHLAIDAPRSIPIDRSEIALSKETDGVLRNLPPAGIFQDGDLFQVKDKLFWSPINDQGTIIDVSSLLRWRFKPSDIPEKMIARVGPLEDAKR